jgi:1,4-alpha-glucan branching enzyme
LGNAASVCGLTTDDLYLFNEGNHFRLYEVLGAHVRGDSTSFAVWAPNARRVSVVGDWNHWNGSVDRLEPVASSGIWEASVSGAGAGQRYKYRIESRDGRTFDKADPFAFEAEVPPRTASIVTTAHHTWSDGAWMADRGRRQRHDAPMSIYEAHVGSFLRDLAPPYQALGYRAIAERLADHVAGLGFTHVELMPVMHHPFSGSWGYQTTGYFAANAAWGTPDDLRHLVDTLHARELGVILDWVPSHFPTDAHGLASFDGTHLYEHADRRQGYHPDWKSLIFNYGRNEVRSFLISNALFWLDRYHADGLRVDAVASMLYLDYSRQPGEWIPNRYGGRENLEAVGFLRRCNEAVYSAYPDVCTIAEESTAWPGVTTPTDAGGLGFGYKWDMGWMHDTLRYLGRDPVHRRFHHRELTFRSLYAGAENYVLPLSHDEVVHGKGSLTRKVPGDRWQQRATLRLLLAYQAALPGKKLLFMGAELGQREEWNHDSQLSWGLLADPDHAGIAHFVGHLMRTYREQPALHMLDREPEGFAWISADDAAQSVLAFLRRAPLIGATAASTTPEVVFVGNFTPVPRHGVRIGVPHAGRWRELANSDALEYGGSGVGNLGAVVADDVPAYGQPCSIVVSLPPLAAILLGAPTDAPGAPDGSSS